MFSKLHKQLRHASGFSLLSLMVLIAIMAVLTVLTLTQFTPNAQAQLGNPGSLSATVNGTVTSNGVGTIPLANASKVSVQLTTVSDAANTSNTVVSLDSRVGAGAWVSTGKTMTIANTGTTSATCVSNWVDLADAEWRVNVQNGAVAGVTNTVIIRYHLKP
jgi:Tfp pilus assembly protein PilE